MPIKQILITLAIFTLAFIPRLYRIDNPVADWHSWRQADTAAVTRNFIKEGFTPLFPKFDSYYALNQVDDDNPQRYFFAEFPIYNILVYPLYLFFGVDVFYSRLVSALVSSFSAVFLYYLVKQFSTARVAVIAAIVFALLPFNVYYGRVVMPDPLHITFTLLSLLLVALWTQQEQITQRKAYLYAFGAGLSTAGMLLTKPYGLVIGIPILLLLSRKYGLSLFKQRPVILYGMISLLPFLAWRWHINQHPEGMFGTDWLYNEGNIRFTGAYFRWLIFDRANRLIFATGGFVLLILGIIRGPRQKEGLFYYSWLIAIIIFFIVIAKGNVTHDYYQLPLVPIGAIFIAKGFEFLAMHGQGLFHRIQNFTLAIFLILIMLAFGWYENRGFFNINHWEIVRAGEAVDQFTPPDAKVIAPYMSDSAFLYQTNRYGWTVGDGLIPQFIAEGATHLISVNYDDTTNHWIDRCQVVTQNPEFVLIDLTNCSSSESEFSPENPPTDKDVYM